MRIESYTTTKTTVRPSILGVLLVLGAVAAVLWLISVGLRAATRAPSVGSSAVSDVEPRLMTVNTTRFEASALSSYSAWDLTVMRNLPFAQNGYAFGTSPKGKKLRTYFERFTWYKATVSNQGACWNRMTSEARRNVETIKRYQARHGQL